MDSVLPFQTSTFGPCRIIGMRYIGDGLNNEIPQLWAQFCARINEIDRPDQAAGFGVCRCVSSENKNRFGEYVAAISAPHDASVPEGMLALDLPHSNYAVFTVPEIPQVRNVWRSGLATLDASTKWKRYACGPAGCTCTTHPAFEYYPSEYRGSGPFFIYVPLKP
jgi:predicted transcriptional regulator YdeE